MKTKTCMGIMTSVDFHARIERLLLRAATTGDLPMVKTCGRALRGEPSAQFECAVVLRDAEAQS